MDNAFVLSFGAERSAVEKSLAVPFQHGFRAVSAAVDMREACPKPIASLGESVTVADRCLCWVDHRDRSIKALPVVLFLPRTIAVGD